MNVSPCLDYSTFLSGVADAESDISMGAFPESVSLDYIVNEFRIRLGCTDEYIVGYLSVIYSK
jgi:hypothetical protein